MITEEKIQEIKRQLRRGVPEGEIKETLKQEGFSPEDISRLFAPKGPPWFWNNYFCSRLICIYNSGSLTDFNFFRFYVLCLVLRDRKIEKTKKPQIAI